MGSRTKEKEGGRSYDRCSGAVKAYLYVATLLCLCVEALAINTDNTCTFKADGNLFTLAVLNRYYTNYYR